MVAWNHWQKKKSLQPYHDVLKILVDMLLGKWENNPEKFKSQEFQEILDLKMQDRIYTLEQALLKMHCEGDVQNNFTGTKMEKCTERCQGEVEKRIKCVQSVHQTRNLLAAQCYVGMGGLQNSGNRQYTKY